MLVRPEVRKLTAYHIDETPVRVKLDAMENHYSWPEAMKREWVATLQQVALNRYPDPDARRLRERLRAALAVPPGMVLVPTPTFVMYEKIATFTGMKFTGVPLTPDFSLDLPAMLKAIETHKQAIVEGIKWQTEKGTC